jgi:hypothetical protein
MLTASEIAAQIELEHPEDDLDYLQNCRAPASHRHQPAGYGRSKARPSCSAKSVKSLILSVASGSP